MVWTVGYETPVDLRVLSTGSEEMQGDEGGSNVENGADLRFEVAQVTDEKSLVLRVELSITDR